MSEREPTTYSTDGIEIDHEVALASHDLRSKAAAYRQASALFRDRYEVGPTDYEAGAEVAQREMAIRAIYGEDGVQALMTPKGVLAEELPELDNRANVVEAVTRALILHPPSQDFLKDFGVGLHRYGNELPVDARDVIQLRASEDYYHEHAARVRRDIKLYSDVLTEIENSEDPTKATKLDIVLRFLERAATYVSGKSEAINKEFSEEVGALKNSTSTTIEDLANLYLAMADRSVRAHEETATTRRRIYDDIVSGRAAEYTSPVQPGSSEAQR